MASVFLTSSAILDIVNEIIEYNILLRGSEEEKQILKLHQDMKQLPLVIQNSPMIEFARMVNAFPQEYLSSLLEDIELTQNDLDSYLRNKNLLALDV